MHALGTQHPLRASPGLWSALLALAAALLSGRPAHGDRPAVTKLDGQGTRVAVVGLSFAGDVTEGARDVVHRRLRRGLTATGVEVVDRGARAGRCQGPPCWRKAWVKHGCRYVLGGRVAAEDRSYRIELWLADARGGRRVARTRHDCELCGLRALADRIDLAASALAAKLSGAAGAPARLAIEVAPAGAAILVDGAAVGPAPRELALTPGAHRITVRQRGYLPATRRVRAVAGVAERLRLRLIPAPTRTSPLRTAGWIGVGAGAATLGVGIALIAVDGNGVGCDGADTVAGGQCRQQLSTSGGGWTLASVGVAAVLTGGYLLYRALRRD